MTAAVAVGTELPEVAQPGVQMLHSEVEGVEHPHCSVRILDHRGRAVKLSRLDSSATCARDHHTIDRQPQQLAGIYVGQKQVTVSGGGDPPTSGDLTLGPYHTGRATLIIEATHFTGWTIGYEPRASVLRHRDRDREKPVWKVEDAGMATNGVGQHHRPRTPIDDCNSALVHRNRGWPTKLPLRGQLLVAGHCPKELTHAPGLDLGKSADPRDGSR
jgi:hypothetical protein